MFRVDPGTGRVVARIPSGGILYGIGISEHAVWSADQLDGRVDRIDPRANRVVAHVGSGSDVPVTFAATPGSVWVTTTDGVSLRIDATTNQVTARVRTARATRAPGDPDTAGGRVWFPDGTSGDMVAVDPATAKVVARLRLPVGYSVAQRGFGDLWVVDFGGSEVARIDPTRVAGA